MFKIEYPKFDRDYRIGGVYLRDFITKFSTYKLANNTSVITGYRDIQGMTSGRYNCPSPSSINLDATVNQYTTNIECDINPLFINSGYKLILSDSFGNPKIFLSNMDHANKQFGGITNDSTNNPFYVLNNAIANTDINYTYKLYSSPNTVYFSFINQYRYMVFTKLLPLNPADGVKYLIIASTQTGDINTPNEILFIDDTMYSASNISYKAKYTMQYAYNYNLFNLSKDDVTLYNYVYDYKWYSEDIFNIYDVSFDIPTLLNGEWFFPLGGGLYLLVKG